jgi:Uma2 family endonuclease
MEAVILRDRVTGSMTDEEFLKFCVQNKSLRIERNSSRQICIMPPATYLSRLYSAEIFIQLTNWNKKDRRGLVFNSSPGFTLPDRSVLCPRVSWLSLLKWDSLTEEDKDKFAPVCPDFVIEVGSKTDDLETLKEKMSVWIKNGAQLGWLIDPRSKTSYIFRPGTGEEKVEGFTLINGEKPVEGFDLDLTKLAT